MINSIGLLMRLLDIKLTSPQIGDLRPFSSVQFSSSNLIAINAGQLGKQPNHLHQTTNIEAANLMPQHHRHQARLGWHHHDANPLLVLGQGRHSADCEHVDRPAFRNKRIYPN